MFLYRIAKKTSPFTPPYFILLTLEYFIHALNNTYYSATQITTFFLNADIVMALYWFRLIFYGYCNTILVLNRFTGVFLWKQHRKIWAGYSFKAIIATTLIYPLIITYFAVSAKEGSCSDALKVDECNWYKLVRVISVFSNLICSLIACILGVATSLARHIKGNSWQKKQQYETNLLIQSVITSFILFTFEVLSYFYSKGLGPFPTDLRLSYFINQLISLTLLNIRQNLFSISSIVLLFIMS
uniref:Serpentine receptor class gamma n=1 Tax=Panagrolaimus davidi TaxID=227884 RepID=A0A914PNG6_9BILA